MDEIRRNMAREILLEKYGVNFFTMPKKQKMYMQDCENGYWFLG